MLRYNEQHMFLLRIILYIAPSRYRAYKQISKHDTDTGELSSLELQCVSLLLYPSQKGSSVEPVRYLKIFLKFALILVIYRWILQYTSQRVYLQNLFNWKRINLVAFTSIFWHSARIWVRPRADAFRTYGNVRPLYVRRTSANVHPNMDVQRTSIGCSVVFRTYNGRPWLLGRARPAYRSKYCEGTSHISRSAALLLIICFYRCLVDMSFRTLLWLACFY